MSLTADVGDDEGREGSQCHLPLFVGHGHEAGRMNNNAGPASLDRPGRTDLVEWAHALFGVICGRHDRTVRLERSDRTTLADLAMRNRHTLGQLGTPAGRHGCTAMLLAIGIAMALLAAALYGVSGIRLLGGVALCACSVAAARAALDPPMRMKTALYSIFASLGLACFAAAVLGLGTGELDVHNRVLDLLGLWGGVALGAGVGVLGGEWVRGRSWRH